jgi:hypothetical protein
MTRLLITVPFITLTANITYSQNPEPLDLAKNIFSKDGFIEIDKYISVAVGGNFKHNVL